MDGVEKQGDPLPNILLYMKHNPLVPEKGKT
jgi:hypothetical protein